MLFDRVIEITVAKDNGEAIELVGKDKENLSVVITGTKFYGTQRDQFKVSIYNLSPVLRGKISSEKYNDIRVRIGHKQSYTGSLFSGTILDIYTRKENGNTTITDFICVDGYDFINNIITTKTFTKGTNYYDIAEYILQHDIQNVPYELAERLKELEIDSDYSIYGNPYEELENLSEDASMFFSSSEEGIKIIDWVDDTDAIVVNENTGMINYPQLSTEGLRVSVIATPTYRIGGLIQINNADVGISVNDAESLQQGGVPSIQFSSDGVYIIKQMDYNLTNRGNDFSIELQCYSRDVYKFMIGGSEDEE